SHHQVTQKGSQQSAAWRVERVPRSQVMPNYPSGRIDPQNQRPHGGRGGKRSYVPHTTGLPPPVPAVCDVRWRVVLASAGASKTIPSTAARLAWRLRASRRRHSIAVADRVIQVAPPVVWTVTTGANTWPSRCSALRGVGRAEQAQEAVVHGVGGFLGGHPAGLDLFFGGAAKGQAGGQQPAGGQGGVQVAAFLAAPDELQHPAEDEGVPAGILLRGDRGQMPHEGV